ncbi:MAG: anthranilate phosphoribosyltransferase [Gemmatimonadaceae bacterium]
MSAKPSTPLQAALRIVAAGDSLSGDQAAAAFNAVMAGEGTGAQLGALLMGLRVKGETADELTGAARALRGAMTALVSARASELVDTCGTGGGAVTTFNISTASAILAAGAGVRVAKHGNRSATTRSGSADVLEALGVAIDVPVDHMGEVLDRAGIVFMFAPTMHPAMRHVGPARREMAIETLMNLVGPLANPASAGRQVIGVASPGRLELVAGALRRLGTVHSLVVHGAPGMDEISPIGLTAVLEVRGESLTRWTVDPEEFGYSRMNGAELAGGEPAENATLIEQVLSGGGPPAAEAAVLLNAAGAIYVSGKAPNYAAALDIARRTLHSGAGSAALERLRAAAPHG